MSKEEADVIAWHAGLIACLGSGLIEFFGAFVVEWIRKVTPRAALLATLAGIGIAFIEMIPVLAAYMVLGIKHALYVGGAVTGKTLFYADINQAFVNYRQFYSDGAFALEQGWVYTSIVLSAATICIIERKFRHASCWFLFGALLSAIGFMHSYEFMPTDVVGKLSLSLSKWTLGYLMLAALMFIAPWITIPNDNNDSAPPI